jgi:uncharacterized protein
VLEVLNQWNRWGRARLSSGHKRDITRKIYPFVDTKEVVALVGLRRAGKTTVLYQLMDYLESKHISEESMLHMNFEEPALAPTLGLPLLDEIYNLYREEVFPTGKAYLFFDEIQNVPGWEKWVRARNESEDVKIFITGSSANLMSRELATVLTGRHVEFYVTPFSFLEIVKLKDIEIPSTKLKVDPPPIIQNALKEYMMWGGFPEIVLSENNERKKILLRQYFDDILFKDVAMRHQIRDVTVLRNIAVHLLTQTASLFSVNRIAKVFQVSLEMAANYCSYIEESFLVDYLPYFSLKAAERNRNPRKIYVNDLGFRQIASISLSMDYGRLAETLVYQHLQRKFRDDIFYWKGKQEIDFVVRSGNEISSVMQVAYDNLDDPTTRQREFLALDEAKAIFKNASQALIVGKMPKSRDKLMTPLWQLLLA